MTPNTNGDQLSDDAPRRIRWKWFILAGVILPAGFVGFMWWYLTPNPLTDEERQFVGWWKPSGGYQYTGTPVSPFVLEAAEYRVDRTIRIRKVNIQTGAVVYIEPKWEPRWKVVDGHLITTYRFDRWNQLRQGNIWGAGSTTYRITWDGPDRYLMDCVDLPPGVVWPTSIHTRWQPPGE